MTKVLEFDSHPKRKKIKRERELNVVFSKVSKSEAVYLAECQRYFEHQLDRMADEGFVHDSE